MTNIIIDASEMIWQIRLSAVFIFPIAFLKFGVV